MNTDLLKRHIESFMAASTSDPERFQEEYNERLELVRYCQSFDRDRILSMTEDDVYEYLARLWAMLIWGNKHYVVDKILSDNGLSVLRTALSELLYGSAPISERWDSFRSGIKGMGPAMISELLCKTHPDRYLLWNRRAFVGLNYLEVDGLPRYDYQLTGDVYERLCGVGKQIGEELAKGGFPDSNLLAVDYFIWHELQVVSNLSEVHVRAESPPEPPKEDEQRFVHNDIRDKLRDIGHWLGFEANTEQKVSEGARVDAVWEATIGNMGRVIYVFEVQTKGSVDSLIVNLLKSLNNPAVQGVVAVSDAPQLEHIRRHARDVKELRDKLKYWNYEEISQVHEALEFVNSCINNLGLVPQGF